MQQQQQQPHPSSLKIDLNVLSLIALNGESQAIDSWVASSAHPSYFDHKETQEQGISIYCFIWCAWTLLIKQ